MLSANIARANYLNVKTLLREKGFTLSLKIFFNLLTVEDLAKAGL